jgi:hypothetical protein
MARFNEILTAIVAVRKVEAFAAHLKKNFASPECLMAADKISHVEPDALRNERDKTKLKG